MMGIETPRAHFLSGLRETRALLLADVFWPHIGLVSNLWRSKRQKEDILVMLLMWGSRAVKANNNTILPVFVEGSVSF